MLLVEAYDPTQRSYGTTAKGPSGFGFETGIALLLPAVWKLTEKIVDKLGDKAADAIAAKAMKILESKKSSGPSDDAALRELTTWAENELAENGVPKDRVATVTRTLLDALRKQTPPS